jgi:glycerate-2-kinase
MTDRRSLLRAIFDAAVAAAHPDVVLGRHLPPLPKGRVICLAAGKGAAALAASAERHYLDALTLEPSRLVGIATTRHGHGVPTRRIRLIEAGENVQHRGLAAAGVSDHAGEFAARHRQPEILEHRGRSAIGARIALCNAFDGNEFVGHRITPET